MISMFQQNIPGTESNTMIGQFNRMLQPLKDRERLVWFNITLQALEDLTASLANLILR